MYGLRSDGNLFPLHLFNKEGDCRKFNRTKYSNFLEVIPVSYYRECNRNTFKCKFFDVKLRLDIKTGYYYKKLIRNEKEWDEDFTD